MTNILPVYNRSDLKFVRGEGVYLYSDKGKEYLDFAAGIAVNSLGHCHPHVTKHFVDQVQKLWHTSNMYQVDGLEEFAKRLCDASEFADYAFFCNSGAESVEAGIKICRNYFHKSGKPNKKTIITFDGAFHGRTMATISAANKPKVTEGFEPLLPGFKKAVFNDIDSVKSLVDENTAGILLEVVQGEGGIRSADTNFLSELRDLCDEHDMLLLYDGVQCGMGRTGKFFSHMWYENALPDICSTAKGIGSGFPLGACLATKKVGDKMNVGSHGTTYGGNPLAARVGNAVLDVMLADGFMENIVKMGDLLMNEVTKLSEKYPALISGVRGKGLMIGMKVSGEPKDFVLGLREKGLLSAPAAENIVRFLPPLIIEEKHVEEAINKLDDYLKNL